jgi:cell division protein FtsQ
MWDDARRVDALARALLVLAVAFAAWAGTTWLVRQPMFAFTEVVVKGPLVRANPAHIEAVIRDELAGTFFTMNLDKSRAALARVPWVRKVALRRQWPHRLEVTVEEQAPLARWNDSGLVNTDGEVFVASYDDDLPQFNGPDGRSAELAARYREWTDALAPIRLSVRAVDLSARGGWRLDAASAAGNALSIEMGRDDPSARLARFIAVYGRTVGVLAGSGTKIEYVDLRYRNGFAARVPGFKERAPGSKERAPGSKERAPKKAA